MEQPDIQKHVNAQIARLVMELATAHAVIEQLQARIRETDGTGGDEPRRETS